MEKQPAENKLTAKHVKPTTKKHSAINFELSLTNIAIILIITLLIMFLCLCAFNSKALTTEVITTFIVSELIAGVLPNISSKK